MPTLVFESRSHVPFCSRCAAFAGFDVVRALAEMASLSIGKESDREHFVDQQLDYYARAVAEAVRKRDCLCPFWDGWVSQLYADAREAELPGSDVLPVPLNLARHIWAERNDFVPVLDYLISVAIPVKRSAVIPLYGTSAFGDQAGGF